MEDLELVIDEEFAESHIDYDDFVYCDGGRSKYFKASYVGDCVTRAIANSTGKDYLEVYNALNELAKKERTGKRKRKVSNSRNGVFTNTAKKYIEGVLGWIWVPCMTIGSGCQVHVSKEDLPSKGTFILNLSRHFSCWKDGKLVDTYDCSRNGSRCVYGYWRAPSKEEQEIFEETKKQVEDFKAFQQKQKEELKIKVDAIKKAHKPTISKLEKKIKELQHQLTLEKNRETREIERVKESMKDSYALSK